ncbi:MAG: 4-hydroxy-tetrahydrodipicolinate reductase, partial [Clostridia bacterium]|nr:4-hydroxy-tetrahydrodipicolinate reductase [Clostridia bacterium]
TAKAFPDANIEIIEKHHNRKLDAPSGTALLLANAIREIREKATYVFGRHGQAKRTENEIGIHAIRMGNIIGEHEVIVGTDTQTITLKHEAHSRALFAEGALAAADYLCGKPAGLYDMERMIADN